MKKFLLLIVIIFISRNLEINAVNAGFGTTFLLSGKNTNKSNATANKVNLPGKYKLNQNYPNPFNPETTIKFTIAKEEYVTIKLYNIIGHEMKVLLSETLNSGEHQVTLDGSDLASGVYLYTLTAGNFSQTKRMVLMK